jgi:YD repeat-containing protein
VTIRIGEHRFDHARYDAEGDVLYLRAGEPQAAALSNASPEGHALRYDEAGNLIGVTIVNARWLLEHDGAITITIPERVRVSPEELGPALAAVG